MASLLSLGFIVRLLDGWASRGIDGYIKLASRARSQLPMLAPRARSMLIIVMCEKCFANLALRRGPDRHMHQTGRSALAASFAFKIDLGAVGCSDNGDHRA